MFLHIAIVFMPDSSNQSKWSLFTPRHPNLHAKSWFLMAVLSCQAFCLSKFEAAVVRKVCPWWPHVSSAPRVALDASVLFAHTIYGMCWAWSALIGRSESVVVWCFEPRIVSFFRGLRTHTPPIPLLGLLLHPTQTDMWFLSFLIPLPLLGGGGIFPSIQILSQSDFYCNICVLYLEDRTRS